MKVIPLKVLVSPPDSPRAGVDMRWRWRCLLDAPHRLGFFCAALMLALSALWWSAVLLGRAAGYSPAWALTPPAAHALLMTLGCTPLFITGFLFTAGPKWLDQPAVAARSLLAPLLVMLLGWCAVLAGLHLSADLAAAGMALVAGGWSALCWHFARLVRTSRMPDRVHAGVVALACVVGALTMWVAAGALASASLVVLRAATQVALWCFVATVFATVSHRMIPFFSASALPRLDAWRPMWMLWLMVSVLWFEALGALAALVWGPLGAPLVGEAAIASMVEHHSTLYADLRDPVALLRGEGASSALSQYWPYAAADAPDALASDRTSPYSALMSASQPLVADEDDGAVGAVSSAGADPAPPADPHADPTWAAEVVRRALSAEGTGIYGLGKGGRDPSAPSPLDARGLGDCSGFLSWSWFEPRKDSDDGELRCSRKCQK